MTFVFQQPGTSPLLDAIEDSAENCEYMGGMFAFSTKDGVDLFLDLPEIQALLTRGGSVHLTVGVDAITNGETLLHLRERMSASGSRLQVRAYVHPYPGTFHPKYMWFVRGSQVTVIVGSGNLTPSGLGCAPAARLRGNWEAFLVQKLDLAGSTHFLQSITGWLSWATDSGLLLEVDDSRSLARGAANSRVRFARPPQDRVVSQGSDGANNSELVPDPLPSIISWPIPQGTIHTRNRTQAPTTSRVRRADRAVAERGTSEKKSIVVRPTSPTPDALPVHFRAFVREVSKSRAGQNEVGIKGFDFFGYRPDEERNILLQCVNLDNTIEEPVKRPLVKSASGNYRVEMPQIAYYADNEEANGERTIMVAVRLDDRTFRYTIVPATHQSYAAISNFLNVKSKAPASQMRKAFVDSDELERSWPEGPRGLFPITMISAEV